MPKLERSQLWSTANWNPFHPEPWQQLLVKWRCIANHRGALTLPESDQCDFNLGEGADE